MELHIIDPKVLLLLKIGKKRFVYLGAVEFYLVLFLQVFEIRLRLVVVQEFKLVQCRHLMLPCFA